MASVLPHPLRQSSPECELRWPGLGAEGLLSHLWLQPLVAPGIWLGRMGCHRVGAFDTVSLRHRMGSKVHLVLGFNSVYGFVLVQIPSEVRSWIP